MTNLLVPDVFVTVNVLAAQAFCPTTSATVVSSRVMTRFSLLIFIVYIFIVYIFIFLIVDFGVFIIVTIQPQYFL